MTLSPTTLQTVNAYWASMFGCDVADLRPTHARAFAHAGFAGYSGVHAMIFGEAAPIVSVPADLLAHAQQVVSTWQPGRIRVASQLTEIPGARAGRVIGPAVLAYADTTTLLASPSDRHVRQLSIDSNADHGLIAELRDTCTPDDWESGGSEINHDPVFGAFAAAALGAVAGYEVWGGRIAHLAIIAHPAKRGRAFGRSAVVAAAQHALTNGLVPQYRTLESNAPSRQIALALGFVSVATSFAVRSRVQDL